MGSIEHLYYVVGILLGLILIVQSIRPEIARALRHRRGLVSRRFRVGLRRISASAPASWGHIGRIGYALLRLDQIPATGNWGITIDRYIELNYPRNDDILSRRHEYMREGSITHTAEALRSLSFTGGRHPWVDSPAIRRWIASNDRLDFIRTDLEAWRERDAVNNEEEVNFTKLLRHTTTATLAQLRMLPFLCVPESRSEVRRWIEERAVFLIGFPKVWRTQPGMVHTRVYMLELLNELRAHALVPKHHKQIRDHVNKGLDLLFAGVSMEQPFWCAETHPETRIYYTLLILVRVLELPEIRDSDRLLDQVRACLAAIAEVASRTGFVPVGGEDCDKRFSGPDLGATALFVQACAGLAAVSGRPLRSSPAPDRLIQRVMENFEESTANAITHTWGAALFLGCSRRLFSRQPSKEFLGTADKLVGSFLAATRAQDRCDEERTAQELDKLCEAGGRVRRIALRDFAPRHRSLNARVDATGHGTSANT